MLFCSLVVVAFFADVLKCVSLIVKPQNLNKIDSLLCPASTTTSQTEDLARSLFTLCFMEVRSLLTANRAIASSKAKRRSPLMGEALSVVAEY
ncbi:hypothetical protein [Calothrix sp. CCY 0018]|uniref:hypothetical protein n=1 Tax=Calothrix sp. CCY 0018 TaxID=3103864 RepID=UPI0039C5B992